MAPGGMNMSVGLDLSSLQKDLKVLDRDLNSKVGQEKILKIKAVIEMDDPKKELDGYTGQIKKVAREGFEPLYRAIKRLQKAQEGLKFNVGGVAYDVNSIKEAQKYMRDLRKEFNAREKNGTMSADWKRQYVDAQAQMSEWVKATRSVARELGSYGLLDYDKEAGKIKSLRAAYNKELKAIKAEMDSLGDVEPRDLKRREELLTRQIALQEKLNATYKRVSPQKQQAVSDLRAERDAIRLKQKQADIQAKINSLEQDRANARGLDRKIDQIRTERVAVGKLVSAYENLANKQRKYGGDPTAAQARAAALRQEHAALKNLEREELNRMKALNQNNSLFNDQGRIIGRLRTLASRYVSIFTIGHLANKIIETTGYFEKQQVALEGIVGSATKAAEIMNQIKAFAPNSPFQTRQLVDYTKKLAAFSIPADKLFDTTKKLADLSAGLGVDMERIILAYGQVKAAAVLRGQELRQFTEAGIPMVDALAKKFSDLNGRLVTTGEVFELISKRQVSFDMVASVLSDMTSEGGKFYRMQENLMNTIYGQREKLKDLWTISLNDIGTGIGGTINRVLKLLQSAIKNAKSAITGLFWGIIVKSAASAIESTKMLIAQFKALGMAAGSVWSLIAVGVGVGIGVMKKLWDENHRIDKQFEQIHESFQRQVRNAIRGLDELIDKFRSTTQGTKAYQDALDTLSANYSQYVDVTDKYVEQLLAEKSVYDSLVEAIKKYNEALEKKQKLEQTKATIQTSFDPSSVGELHDFIKMPFFEKKYKMTYESAKGSFNDAMEAILRDMLQNNRLSFSEDKDTRWQENQRVFLELLPKYMRAEGIGSLTNDINRFGLWNKFAQEALYDNDSRRVYKEYQKLMRESTGQGTSDFAWMSRIEAVFRDLPTTLSRSLESATPQEYSRQYNAGWVRAAYNYLKTQSDFSGRVKSDENGNPILDKNGQPQQYAKTEFDALIAGIERELANFDEASISNVHNLFDQYHRALSRVDEEGAAMLSHLIKLFDDGTDEASDRAAAVRETIFKTWAPNSSEMKFARQYLPTNETYNTIREKLPQEHIKRIEDLSKYGIVVEKSETIPTKRYKSDPNRQHSPGDLAEIERLKMEERVIAKLMEGVQEGVTITVQNADGTPLKAQMFDIMDREKNFTGGGGHNREFPEFVNIFKDAYALYKRATTEGGMEAGVAKVRTDKTIKEMYGDFFGSKGSIEAFKFKIGGKTIAKIIQDNLITGGIEDGIVNFKEAATAAANEMIRYGKADEDKRGHFIREGQRLLKWVADTFADDSVAKWLNELSKATENLTISFENMRADQDLARNMVANGTLDSSYFTVKGSKGAFPGMETLARPGSDIQRSFISNLLGEYNQWAAQAKDENGVNIATPFNFVKDIKDMNLDDIADALKQITDESDMNMQAFRATKEGNIMMNKLTAALKELDKTVRDEAAKVSGKAGTGNRLSDAVHNAKINADKAILDNETIQKIAATLNMSPDQVAASMRVDAAKGSADDILKAFLESNNYETMFKAFRQPIDFSKIEGQLDKLIAKLPEIERMEVQRRYDVMKGEADVFNAKHGDFAPFFAGLDNYRTADSRAQKVWNKYATDSKATQLGATFNADKNAWDIPETVTDPEALAYLNELNRSLDDVGKNGIKLSAVFKQQALDSVKKFASTAQNTLNSMSDVVKNLVASVQAFVKAFNKAYDVMNDGENPKWMQDTEAFLGDFAENFEAMIAPMSAVIALIIAITVAITVCKDVATPLLIVMAAVVAASAILAAIIAAFQQHDRKLEHSIEGLKEDIESFDRAITNLQAAAERSVGFEKLRKNIAATGKEIEKATAYAEMARLEEEKKNTDESKVKEYKQSYQEAMDSFLNGMREVRDELVSSTEDWANAMGSAIRSAFQNGENAARAFRDTVKTMIGDVIENMLEMAILQPLIENALENWTNSDYLRQKYTKEWTEKDENGNVINRKEFDQDNYLKELLQNISDPDKAENFYQSMLMIGDTLIDTVNGMPSVLQDFYKHNSELGTLSGGIESVTEDTARRIEALENSQLGEIFAIRTILEQYLSNSGGFGDSTMASVQAAVVSIASDTSVICRIMQSFENQLNELRTSPARPLHVTMV